MQLTEKNTKDMRVVRGLCNVLSSNLGNAIPLAPENCVANASAVTTAMDTASKLRAALDIMLWGIPLDARLPEVADTTDLIPVKGHDLYTTIKYLRALATASEVSGTPAHSQHVRDCLGKISDRFAAALTAGPSEPYTDAGVDTRALVQAYEDAEARRPWGAPKRQTPAFYEGWKRGAAYTYDHGLPMADQAPADAEKTTPPLIRWNFDRFVHGQKKADGVAVHAADAESAREAAGRIMRGAPSSETLSFRDNNPCAGRCVICWPATPDHRPDRAFAHQGPTPPDVPHDMGRRNGKTEIGAEITLDIIAKAHPETGTLYVALRDHGDSAHAAEHPLPPGPISELPKGVDPAILLRDSVPNGPGELEHMRLSIAHDKAMAATDSMPLIQDFPNSMAWGAALTEWRERNRAFIGMDPGAPDPTTTASDILADIMKTVQPVGGRYVITRGDGLDFQAAMRNADNYFMFKARESARKAKSNDKH